MTGLVTFDIPETVTGTPEDIRLGQRMIEAWQRDGIYQVAIPPAQRSVVADAYAASRRFFSLPLADKSRHLSDLSYSGYVASGEEVTDGVQDGSEIFTVTKDVSLDDSRVAENWPCHGPVPWPDEQYREAINAYMEQSGDLGERILRLTALGLGQDIEAFTRLTDDGWHHMRVLRFPAASATTDRGIGAHTDYGLLVIAPRTRPDRPSTSGPRSRASAATATGCPRRAQRASTRTTTAGPTSRRCRTPSPCSPATSSSSSPAEPCSPHLTR
ncbi:2-oxoglutarate and iron-dependent oxygenase domain-containing protein [Streptomyces griseoruber]|uniref:2-oxoglutarate and iron-dependent oxygenase domain-containing protein n=1 Tax=Streptomyces griseoruber TaxID=1943 RepID=UPI001F0ADCD4|nr:2-oxoglutarate and iron-dependent oxygenase domain-containing protein [Streptomyces griseoruber]